MQQLVKLARDFLSTPNPDQILFGEKLFRPFLKYQKSWISHFYPGDTISVEKDIWYYLQKYVMPFIKKHASSYHVKGIELLKLNSEQKPDFKEFQDQFYTISKGFQIEPVNKEIAPREYFYLISQKKFPCIKEMRNHAELFCANEPDFWHEAIGHIAPLCFQEVQDIYLQLAHYLLSAKTAAQFRRHLAIAWTLSEYGFLNEFGQPKMFGAALVGSHLANIRYLNKIMYVEPANRTAIIKSGFFDEDSPLPRYKHKIRFFCLNDLNIAELFRDEVLF